MKTPFVSFLVTLGFAGVVASSAAWSQTPVKKLKPHPDAASTKSQNVEVPKDDVPVIGKAGKLLAKKPRMATNAAPGKKSVAHSNLQ
jgi:hypothetical protein